MVPSYRGWLLAGLLLAAAVPAAAQAATIEVGSDTANGYTLHLDTASETATDNLTATTGPGALAYSNTGVGTYHDGAFGTLILKSAGSVTIDYHFQADEGYQITAAAVEPNSFATASNDTDWVTAAYSTDDSTWTQFSELLGATKSGNDLDDAQYALTGINSRDLYLRYTLSASGGYSSQIFRSDLGGFFVNLDLAAAPEPASLALLGLGALAMLPRRRKTRVTRGA